MGGGGDPRELAIMREGLEAMVEQMVAGNRVRLRTRPTDGQRALDRAMAALHDDGEIELAAAIGLLRDFRAIGNHAVAKGLTALLETAAELDRAGWRGGSPGRIEGKSPRTHRTRNRSGCRVTATTCSWRSARLVVGLDAPTARQLAESLLVQVGRVQGRESLLLAAGYEFSTRRKPSTPAHAERPRDDESRGTQVWADDSDVHG